VTVVFVTRSNWATAVLIAASPVSEKLGSRHSRREAPAVIRLLGAGTDVVVVAATVVVVVELALGDSVARCVTKPRAVVGGPPDIASAASAGTMSAEALTARIAVIATRSCLTNVAYP